MRSVLSTLGTALIVIGVVGIGALAFLFGPWQDQPSIAAPAPVGAAEQTAAVVEIVPADSTPTPIATGPGASAGSIVVPLDRLSTFVTERLPITRVVATSIDLDAEVVPSQLIQKDGGTTWEVPAFKAGHADYTAGAGQLGNAVLLGHVSSVRSGNVFEELNRVAVGDEVSVWSGERKFVYRVVDAKAVPRTDTSVMETTSTPSITLITCIGTWSPVLWDYTERFVVRAELVSTAPLS